MLEYSYLGGPFALDVPSLSRLIELINTGSDPVKGLAISIISQLVSPPSESSKTYPQDVEQLIRLDLIPLLISHVSSASSKQRVDAFKLLAELSRYAEHATPIFIKAFEDPALRSSAAIAILSFWPASIAAIPGLVNILETDEPFYTRIAARYALEQIGLDLLQHADYIMRYFEHYVASKPEDEHRVHLHSIFALERMRALRSQDTSAQKIAVTSSSGKKDPVELEKSLLALLDTCVEWEGSSVSSRKLKASESLKRHREQMGLDPDISLSTIGNHLRVLAQLCGVPSLMNTSADKQTSAFCTGVQDRLRALRPRLKQPSA